jgi:hypothetical protein
MSDSNKVFRAMIEQDSHSLSSLFEALKTGTACQFRVTHVSWPTLNSEDIIISAYVNGIMLTDLHGGYHLHIEPEKFWYYGKLTEYFIGLPEEFKDLCPNIFFMAMFFNRENSQGQVWFKTIEQGLPFCLDDDLISFFTEKRRLR